VRIGIVRFIEDPPVSGNGFKSEYFAKLARVAQSNFWFCARNRLIQWAMGDYFPDAQSSSRLAAKPRFVLRGAPETLPLL